MPGHSPRFEPRKLRDSGKLNWSTVVFLISTLSENAKLKNDSSEFILTRAPSTTIGVVLVQGTGQSESNNFVSLFGSWVSEAHPDHTGEKQGRGAFFLE